MWSIKLRVAVFCLQIQAINTFETPIKTNLTERRTGANLIGQNYSGLDNGARLYDMDGLNKMLPLSEYNTNSSNLYSIGLSQNGTIYLEATF